MVAMKAKFKDAVKCGVNISDSPANSYSWNLFTAAETFLY